jgi:hypothetical protein
MLFAREPVKYGEAAAGAVGHKKAVEEIKQEKKENESDVN